MLIHNNRFPKVSTFKEGQVEDVYVSKSETVGAIKRAEEVLDINNANISDYVGYDPFTSDMELIAEKANNTFQRVRFIKEEVSQCHHDDDAKRIDLSDTSSIEKGEPGEINFSRYCNSSLELVAKSHLDTSLQDPKIVSRSRQNDLLGVIRSDVDDAWASIRYEGVENKLYNSICLGPDEYNRSPHGTFNPYYRYKMSDIIKSFNINGEIYNIHRGGYISIVDTREKRVVGADARIVNFLEATPYKETLELHNDRIFNKFQYSNTVTNASFNGKDVILITTPNELFIFSTRTHKFETVNGFSRDCVIIDVLAKGDKYYAILGTYKEDVLIPLIIVIDSAGQRVRIQPEGNVEFPNTIVSVGKHIVFYNKVSKAFPKKTYNENFSRRMTFLHYNEKTGKSGVFSTPNILGASNVAISFIEGSDIDNVFVGVKCLKGTKNHSVLNNAILHVNKLTDVKLYLENQFNVGLNGQDVDSLFQNNHIYVHDKNVLEIIRFSGPKVVGNKILEATKGRSTTASITGVSIVGDNVIILYNDNTHGIYKVSECESLISPGLTCGNGGFRDGGCVVSHDDTTFILEDKTITAMFNNDVQTAVLSNHSYDIFDLYEREIIFKECTKRTRNDFVITIMTKHERDIVSHAVQVNVSSSLVEIETRFPASFKLDEEDKIIVSTHTGFDGRFITVPVMCASCKVFLVVFDIEEEITIINKIKDDEDYVVWKVPFCDENAETISLQIHGDVHRIPLLTNFFDGEDAVNGQVVNEHELQLLIDCSEEDYPLEKLLISTGVIVDGSLDKEIAITNGIRINDLTGPRTVVIQGRDPYYLFIDNFFMKVYDVDRKLIGTLPLPNLNSDQRINGVEHLGGKTYRIDTDKGIYYTVNLNDVRLNQRATCTSLDVEYVCSRGVYVFYDEYGVISLYDTVDGKMLSDVLNSITTVEHALNQFRSDVNGGCRFKVNNVEKNLGMYYIQLSVHPGNGTASGTTDDLLNYYLLTISLNEGRQESRLFYIGSSDETNSDEIINSGIIANVETDFATFALTTHISSALSFYYSDSFIKCRYINADDNELNPDVYIIKSFDEEDVFLGLNSPERSKVDIYYINKHNDVVIDSVDVDKIDSLHDSELKPPTNTTRYRVLFRNESISFINQTSGADGVRFRHCDKNGPSYDVSYYDLENVFDRFPHMVGRTESSISLYNDNSFITLGFGISSDKPFMSKRGYSYYNYKYSENLFSNLLFNRFSYSGYVSCISTGGLSRGITDIDAKLGERYIKGISNEIIISDTPIIEYDLNLENCVKDMEYYQIIRSEKAFLPDVLHSNLVYNETGGNRYVNYTQLEFDQCVAVTTCFDGTLKNGGDPDPNTSYSIEVFTEERTETNEGGTLNTIILSKDKSVDGAFSSIESINGDNSRFSEPDFDIWPLYCDEDGLHSVISKKDRSVTAFLTNVGTPEIISGVTNFKTAVKIPGYNCIFLLTEERLITYDVEEKREVGVGLKIKDLKNAVLNLNKNYTPVHILKMMNNFRCNLLVKSLISGKLFVAPACRMETTIVGDRVSTTINADDVDVLESYDLVGNNYLNPYVSRDTRYMTLNDNVLIKMSKSTNYTLTFTSVRSDKELGSVENPLLIYEFEAYRNEVKPAVFIAKNFWLLQRNNMLEIYRVGFDAHPHALAVYVIEQPYFLKLRTVTQFMDAANKVMIAFNDGTCKEIAIPPEKEDRQLWSRINYAPDMYDLRPVFDVSDMTGLSYFLTVYGVGFIANKGVHLFKEQSNDYVTVPTGKVRSYAVDYINNRVYIIDEDNNFGYVLVGGGMVDKDLHVIPKTPPYNDEGRISVVGDEIRYPAREPNESLIRNQRPYYIVADSKYVPVNVLDALYVMEVTFNNQTFITYMTNNGLSIYLKDVIHRWVDIKLDNEKWECISPRNRNV